MISFNSHQGQIIPITPIFISDDIEAPRRRVAHSSSWDSWMSKLGLGSGSVWSKASADIVMFCWLLWCFPPPTFQHHRLTGWSHDISEEERITEVIIYLVQLLSALRRKWKPNVSGHPSLTWWEFSSWRLAGSSRNRICSASRQSAQKLAPDHFWQVHTTLCPQDKGRYTLE